MAVLNALRRWTRTDALLLLLLLPVLAFANERQEGMARCFVTLSLEAQDNFLSRQEYVVAVNNLSNGKSFGSSFDELPQVLQDNFNTLAAAADANFINIHGVRPGQGGDTDFVERVCLATQVAIDEAAAAAQESLAQSAPDTAPVAASDSARSFTGDITIRNEFIISNILNLGAAQVTPESVQIGELETAYGNMAMEVLRRVDDFGITLAPNSVVITAVVDSACPRNVLVGSLCQEVLAQYRISVFNEDEQARRNEFTDTTATFIRSGVLQDELDQVNPASPFTIEGISTIPSSSVSPDVSPRPTLASSPSVSPAPSVSPESLAPSTVQAASTPRPTRPLNQCYVGMITTDDDFDKRLNRTEYVAFLQFLKPGSYVGLQFPELPIPLIDNFDELATNNEAIDILGLPRPDDEQAMILQMICDDTNAAISAECCIPSPTVFPTDQPSSSIPSVAPSGSPSFGAIMEPPTVQPTQNPSISPSSTAPSTVPSVSVQPSVIVNETEVVNQFVISNTVGVRAEQLNMPGNAQRDQLDNAYDTLVESVVSETIKRRQVRGRRLVVNYAGGSTKFYVDSECPEGTIFGSVCQEVVASFLLGIAHDENVTDVVDRVQDALNSSIASGDLQSRLTDQGSPIMVEEGAPIVNQPSGSPSLAPSMTPSTAPTTGAPSRSPAVAPSPAPTSENRNTTGGLTTPVIIGIAAGGAIALFLGLGGCALCCSKRSKRTQGSRALQGDEEDNQYFGPKDGLQEEASSQSSSGSSGSSESSPSSTGTGSNQPSLPIRQDTPDSSH